MAVAAAIFVDTTVTHSAIRRATDQYLTDRWMRTLGIDQGGGGRPEVRRIVDDVVGSLPQPPKEMKVVAVSGGLGPVQGSVVTPSSDAGPYARQQRRLIRDVRTFAACNFGLFLLTSVLLLLGRSRVTHYVLPAGLLALGTLSSIVIYVAARDWFWGSLDGGHLGIGYLAFVGSVALLLADILWNRARVVSRFLRLLSWVPV
jgi:hypothetical protein